MSDRKNITHFPEIQEPLLNTLSDPGKNSRILPCPFEDQELSGIDREENLPEIPDVSEVEVVRHFTRLSRLNYGIDHGMYPLGSCTMKYNPKISEEIAGRFTSVHPGDNKAMHSILGYCSLLQKYLKEICGMDACCLWPAAGAHGELTGMMTIKKAVETAQTHKNTVLIPDTAHGTNPASCAIAGFTTKNIPSGENGYLTASILKDHLGDDVAALMITNPNTLGIFEREIADIAALLHENGSYLYMDGANLNAIMGIARPGDIGVDCMHINLHKTFGTPHGGGGPGSGPVLAKEHLARFLPLPDIAINGSGEHVLSWDRPESIGMVHSCMGNVNVLIKALTYILSLGGEGLRRASIGASLNANYLKKRLTPFFDLPYSTPTLHEFVFSDRIQKQYGVTTMDMAKALMESGFHPPTIYFPLVVSGAIMIEPTETEPVEELDRFVDAMETIAGMSRENPESLHETPEGCPTGRIDEVWAARNLVLTWAACESNEGDTVSK